MNFYLFSRESFLSFAKISFFFLVSTLSLSSQALDENKDGVQNLIVTDYKISNPLYKNRSKVVEMHEFSVGSRSMGNEDRVSYQIFESGTSYYGVFDGHGGDEVSCLLCFQLLKFLEEKRQVWINQASKISDLFEEFDEVYAKKVNRKINDRDFNPGSTAVVMIDVPESNYIIFANLGDSPLLVVKKNKSVLRSTDHQVKNPVEADLMKQKLKQMKGQHTDEIEKRFYEVKKSFQLSGAFGDAALKDAVRAKPDIFRVPRNEIAFVILASDGVEEHMEYTARFREYAKFKALYDGEEGDGLSILPSKVNDLLLKEQNNYNVAEGFYKTLTKGNDDFSLLVVVPPSS